MTLTASYGIAIIVAIIAIAAAFYFSGDNNHDGRK